MNEQNTKTLVMWSGGLDSTYGLIRLLSETDDAVFAHHISRHARSDSGQDFTDTAAYEDRAVNAMRSLIEARFRPFQFSLSAINLRAFPNFARDTSTAMFFAAHAARSYEFGPRDRILLSMNSDEDKSWNPGSELYDFLRSTTLRVLRTAWEGEDFPECFLWDPPPSKRVEAAYVPKDVLRLTASCRDPRYDEATDTFQKCGICPECVTLSALGN